MRGYLLAGKEEFLEPYVAGRETFSSRVTALKSTVSDNPAQVTLLDEMQANLDSWQADVTEPTINLRREIGDAKTMDDMADLVGEARGKVYFDEFRALMGEFSKIEEDLMKQRMSDSRNTLEITYYIIFGCVSLGLLIGTAVALIIGRLVSKPIVTMTAAMSRLANGDTSIEIPGRDRKDELGQMAETVAVFRDNLIRTSELAEKELAEQKSKEARNEALSDLTQDFEQDIKDVLSNFETATDQLGQSASKMLETVNLTNQQATNVAASSEQATANVQNAASAAEELTASIREIGVQVEDSQPSRRRQQPPLIIAKVRLVSW